MLSSFCKLSVRKPKGGFMNKSLLLFLLLSTQSVPVICTSPVQAQIQTKTDDAQKTPQQQAQDEQNNYALAYSALKYGGMTIGAIALFYVGVHLYVSYYED